MIIKGEYMKPKKSDILRLEVGDRIEFKALTRWAHKKVTRLVTGFYGNAPTVRYGGWSNFVVRHCEISKIIKKEIGKNV